MTHKLAPLFAAALAAWLGQVQAAGFGPASSMVQLGQPLSFAVQVRLEPGETIAPECISAEVALGERVLPGVALRTTMEYTGAEQIRVRVLSNVVVDEPVVSVAVTLGCTTRLARRFVVFAEPPLAAPPVAPAFAANPTPVPPAETAAPAAASVPGTVPRAGEGAAVPAAAAATTASGGTRVALRSDDAAGGGRTAASEPARAASPRPQRRARPATAARPASAPVTAAAPRLRLEAAPPPPKPEAEALARALEAVAQAASAADAAASAASAAAQRVATLERTVEQLRSEGKAQQEVNQQLRQRLAAAEDNNRWVLPLGVAVLLFAGLSAWLGSRLSAARRVQREDWRAEATRAPATPGPATTQMAAPTTAFATVPAIVSAPAGARWHRGTPAWPPPAPAPLDPWAASQPAETQAPAPAAEGQTTAFDVMKTLPLPGGSAADEAGTRDVTIEELIDLEQQAEFFIVLGQDEAAIDLLVEHLRSTGGGSPLPYLKLLEIYHRRGEREAYERTRTRFNHRFNAYAPEWGADLTAGRSLEDYPGVVPRLQQAWPRPLDAMAELEALLFRRSQGELFDLPAYREVLFLYSLARDLLDRKSADGGNVDFLLPMSETTEFGATAPQPYLGLETDVAPLPEDKRLTVPLDLDVTRDGQRPSLFGDLDPTPAPSGPRRH